MLFFHENFFPNFLFDRTLDMGHTRLDIKDIFIETVRSDKQRPGTKNMERKQFQFNVKNWQNILLVKF